MAIYLVFALAYINASSVFAARVILSLYALELGAQPFTVGILAATFSAFPMLLAVQAGRFADRFGSRWMLIFGAAVASAGMLVPYLVPGLPALFVAAAVMGLELAAFNVSLQNLVGLLSDADNRTVYFSNFNVIKAIANFTGPLIAGFSIDLSGHGTACLYIALITLVPVAMVAIWGHVLPGGTRHTAHKQGGIRDMLADPSVRRVLTTSSLLHVGNDLYQFYMPVYAHAAGLSASAIGIVLSMFAAAESAVRLILPRLIARFKEEQLLAYVFYLSAVSLMLVPLFKDAVMLGLISFVFGLGMGCGGPIVTMMMFSNSPDGRSGEALGLKITINHFTKIVGPVAFGAIGSAVGLPPMFWVNAVMMGGGGMLSRPRK